MMRLGETWSHAPYTPRVATVANGSAPSLLVTPARRVVDSLVNRVVGSGTPFYPAQQPPSAGWLMYGAVGAAVVGAAILLLRRR